MYISYYTVLMDRIDGLFASLKISYGTPSTNMMVLGSEVFGT